MRIKVKSRFIFLGSLYAIHPGHLNVHYHYIGPQVFGLLDCLKPICRSTDHREV